MFGGTAAEAFDRAGARRSLVCRFTTLVASGVLVTEFDSVTESLTFVAAHGIGNEDFDVVSNVAGEKSGRQGGCLEGKAEQTGVTRVARLGDMSPIWRTLNGFGDRKRHLATDDKT